MFPASRSGKISTFAFPATGLPGALDAPTDGTIAASSWNSPSMRSPSGAFSFAIFVASTTLSTSACFALPFVECERSATTGSFSFDISGATIVDPAKSEKTDAYIAKLVELREKKGMTEEKARELLLN